MRNVRAGLAGWRPELLLVPLLALLVPLLALSGRTLLVHVHAHDGEGPHGHLLSAAHGTEPAALAEWHAHHHDEDEAPTSPADEPEPWHDFPDDGASLELQPLFVQRLVSPGFPSLGAATCVRLDFPSAVAVTRPSRAEPASERAPPRGRSVSGLIEVLRRSHALRI